MFVLVAAAQVSATMTILLNAPTSIVDGDTLHFRLAVITKPDDALGIKVRLIGVDTPETKDPRKPVQEFSQQASDFISNLLKGEKV